MTCIVGLVEENHVYIGADSLGTDDYHRTHISTFKKLFRKGDFLIGCSGSIRMIELLQYVFVAPEFSESDDVNSYMVSKVAEEIKSCFEKAALKEDDRGGILVGFKGRLFFIDGYNYQIEEDVCGYRATGCASDFAVGVLWATRGLDMPALSRVEFALEASAEHNAYVRRPFIIESI